jgi:SAM-dependent methyltransferase
MPPAPSSHRRRHRAAARAMLAFPEPESWLDVGTGDALFPETARELFPYTSFDGLDPTTRVVAARAAERVEEAHVGHLADPHIAARLRARYDIVTMFRHLGHTPNPRAELHAALAALRPGGHLVVELPNPRCVFARLLGKWWVPHGRPRHLIPLDALRTALEYQGCSIISVDRRAAHIPHDLAAAASQVLGRRLRRPALKRASVLVVAVAAALDHALAPLLRRTPFANGYRVIARKDVIPRTEPGNGPDAGQGTSASAA